MGDSRHEIHDGLKQAATDVRAERFDEALAEMTRLNDRFTIPPLASLIDSGRALKRKKDRTDADLEAFALDLERVAKEMGPV